MVRDIFDLTEKVSLVTGGNGGIGLGMALAARVAGQAYRTFVVIGDGESNEGSVWEAAMSAAHHGLGNLICIVDINNQQADGPSSKVLGFEPLADKWASFGWHVQRVDGNHLPAVLRAFDTARALTEATPLGLLCDGKVPGALRYARQVLPPAPATPSPDTT